MCKNTLDEKTKFYSTGKGWYSYNKKYTVKITDIIRGVTKTPRNSRESFIVDRKDGLS